MTNHLRIFYQFTLLLILFPLLGSAQVISKESKDLFIVGSESITFKSEINNKEYKLYVNLPEKYATDSTKVYPVFYTLDGHGTFGYTTSIYNNIRFDAFVPEMIIVGITYGGEKPDYDSLRNQDLTPTAIVRIVSSGGAPKYLSVLEDELIPMIDSIYRTDKTNRTLAGTSYGGLFAHYVLLNQPSLFNGYILNNPSFGWDNDYSFKLEEEYYRNNKSLNAKVIFFTGEFDNGKTNIVRMHDQMKRHQYKKLDLDFREVENMGHLGGESEARSKGMRFIYKRPGIILPEKDLQEYCGTYQAGDYMLEIVIRDGELTLIHKFRPEGEKIQAISKSEFAVSEKYLDFHFNRNEEGKVISFFRQRDHWNSGTPVKMK